jgi:sec-independent protein translocase protein TatA
MIGDILQPTHLLFLLVVGLLVLGPKRLPEVGKALGSGLRDFKTAINGIEEESHAEPTSNASAPTAPDLAAPASAVVEPTPVKTPTSEPRQPDRRQTGSTSGSPEPD